MTKVQHVTLAVLFFMNGLLGAPTSLLAQESLRPGMYVIFDGSNSMWGELPDKSRKIAVAKQAVMEFLGGEFEGHDLALRVYGHRKKGDCRDSELVIPFGASADVAPKLQKAVEAITPRGKTPISYSLREALKDFGDRPGEIILITDGIETCDVDPCALLKEWKESGVKVNVHVVGLGIGEKSKPALQCLADAAGTPYHDAHSTQDLVSGLAKIKEQVPGNEFGLSGVTEAGKNVSIEGWLLKDRQRVMPLESNHRYVIEGGTYEVMAGIKTLNGEVYQPVTQAVEIAKIGSTEITLQVPEPPSAKAVFMEKGKSEPVHGSITALQNGKEVFHFRAIDEVYLNEGTYEFRTQPNADNELTIIESFTVGDHKKLVFNLVDTVRVWFKYLASGSGMLIPGHSGLWQNGEKQYQAHSSNYAIVRPGTYDLHLESKLYPYVKNGVVITEEATQDFEIIVPMGHVTVRYQKADGTPDEDVRMWIGRGADGPAPTTHYSGTRVPLLPGTYNVKGFDHEGKTYDRPVFTIGEGEEKELILRTKK